jgi:hypothetical protein
MTIFEFGAIGEFAGAFGVVASVLYLALQIKRNNSSLDAAITTTYMETGMSQRATDRLQCLGLG